MTVTYFVDARSNEVTIHKGDVRLTVTPPSKHKVRRVEYWNTDSHRRLYADLSPLDPDFKIKWLKALRGGRFEQVKGVLRKKLTGHFGYCCLGLGCNIVGHRKGWAKAGWTDSDKKPIFDFGAIAANDTASFPFLPNNDLGSLFAALNDSDWTFAEIADFVDEYL